MQPETRDYAEYIGLDLLEYPELVWIAEEGLHCPLPNGWSIVRKETGHYFENLSGKTQADHPMDDHYRRVALREVQHIKQTKVRETVMKLATVEPLTELPPSCTQKTRTPPRNTSFRFWVYLFFGSLLLHLCTSNLFFAPRPRNLCQPSATKVEVRENVYVVQRETTQARPSKGFLNETSVSDLVTPVEQSDSANNDEDSNEGWWF